MKISGIITGILFMAISLFSQPLQMVVHQVPSDPTISFRIVFKTGSVHDPKGKEGLAYLTARMIAEGSTQKHSYSELLDLFYPMAAGFNTQVDKEVTVFLGRTHKDNLEEYYQLVKEILFEPAFQESDFERIKNQTLSYLGNTLRYASDEELGKAALFYLIFEGTPYAHPEEGLYRSVQNLTLDDVRWFYRQYYVQSNLLIGLGGGVDPNFVSQVKGDFSELPVGKPAGLPEITLKNDPEFKVLIVEKPGASATAISLGFPLPLLRGSEDWYALDIARSWLGEHRNSSSHLYQVIREQRGLNYGDYAYIEFFPNGGRRQFPPQNVVRHHQLFEIWIRPVPNEARHFALRAALREYKKLIESGLTDQEFQLTRKFLSSYILNYAPTTMSKLGYLMDDVLYGIDGHHLDKYRKYLETAEVGKTNEAIKKYWKFEGFSIAFVTDKAQELADALSSNAPSPITYQVEKPAEILKEDAEISTFPLPVKKENIRIISVTDLFQ